jgi:hypothetical protein
MYLTQTSVINITELIVLSLTLQRVNAVKITYFILRACLVQIFVFRLHVLEELQPN